MNNKIKVKPDKFRLVNLLKEVSDGKLKIPIFQREFEWDKKQMLDLFDSLRRGYPIGSLLLWEPKVRIKDFGKIGPYTIDSNENEYSYILDGFQRVSTLFGILTNPSHFKGEIENDELNDYKIYYDLKEEEFISYSKSNAQKYHLIPLYTLIDTFDLLEYVDELRYKITDKRESGLYIQRARELATTLIDYEISYVRINGGDIQSAVEIFSRVNSKGSKISIDWMVSALSYVKDNFLLADEITKLLTELEEFNFQSLKRDTIIHCIKTASGKPYFDVNVEKLARKTSFQNLSRNTFENIKKAVQFLYNECKIIDYRLLPYDTQLIFVTEFFRIKQQPSNIDKDKLKKWIWKTSYTNYFSIYSLSKQRKAFIKLNEYTTGKKNSLFYASNTNEEFLTSSFPKGHRINFGSVRMKSALLFMLNRYFNTRSKMELNNKSHFTGNLVLNYINLQEKVIGNLIIKEGEIDKLTLVNKKINDVLFENTFDKSFLEKLYEQYFMNDYIHNCFINQKYDEGISARTKLIKEEEEKFVKNLGVIYNN